MATLAASLTGWTHMRDEDQEPTQTLRRWTREEYDRMVDAGILTTRDKVQLIEGEIVEMSPQKKPHVIATHRLNQILTALFPTDPHVLQQAPLALSDDSEPEPDLAVVAGRIDQTPDGHATGALLVVEVSQSSLAFDRSTKARMYARAGIPEYWIVNLRDRCVEVYRQPLTPSHTDAHARYGSVMTMIEGETLAPLAAPDARISVRSILPPPSDARTQE